MKSAEISLSQPAGNHGGGNCADGDAGQRQLRDSGNMAVTAYFSKSLQICFNPEICRVVPPRLIAATTAGREARSLAASFPWVFS